MAHIRGINRPGAGKFGPDLGFYLVDFGVVRNGDKSGRASGVMVPAAAAVAQIPGIGVIWRISRD